MAYLVSLSSVLLMIGAVVIANVSVIVYGLATRLALVGHGEKIGDEMYLSYSCFSIMHDLIDIQQAYSTCLCVAFL